MYRSILVPLDRSSFSEQALPLAAAIAERARAGLDLVEVHRLYALDDPTAGWARYEPERDADYKEQEHLYLDATARWMSAMSSVSATTAVLPGCAVAADTIADGLLKRAADDDADLIVMATHGRGPLGRLGRGSVADELIRRAPIPLLLVRAVNTRAEFIPGPVVDEIVIALDESSQAEQVLEPALELARVMEARCTLLRVVESRPRTGHSEVIETTDQAMTVAYLNGLVEKLRSQEVPIHTRVVRAWQAADAILAESKKVPNRLIALATHGRGGLKRLVLGSVADQVLRETTVPVLLQRARPT